MKKGSNILFVSQMNIRTEKYILHLHGREEREKETMILAYLFRFVNYHYFFCIRMPISKTLVPSLKQDTTNLVMLLLQLKKW